MNLPDEVVKEIEDFRTHYNAHPYERINADKLRSIALLAFTEGRRAGLEEAAKVCERMLTKHGERKKGSDTADAARRVCIAAIRDISPVYLITALTPYRGAITKGRARGRGGK